MSQKSQDQVKEQVEETNREDLSIFNQKCTECQRRYESVPATYANLEDFNGSRFLCDQCATDVVFKIPFSMAGCSKESKVKKEEAVDLVDEEPKVEKNPKTKQFLTNLQVNIQNQHAKKLMALIRKLYKQKVETPLKNLTQITNMHLNNWKKSLETEFRGIVSTFSKRAIANWLEMLGDYEDDVLIKQLKEEHVSDGKNPQQQQRLFGYFTSSPINEDIILWKDAFLFSGRLPLTYIDQLMDTLVKNYDEMSKYLEQELGSAKLRYSIINSKLNGLKVEKGYKQKVNALQPENGKNGSSKANPWSLSKQLELSSTRTKTQNGKSDLSTNGSKIQSIQEVDKPVMQIEDSDDEKAIRLEQNQDDTDKRQICNIIEDEIDDNSDDVIIAEESSTKAPAMYKLKPNKGSKNHAPAKLKVVDEIEINFDNYKNIWILKKNVDNTMVKKLKIIFDKNVEQTLKHIAQFPNVEQISIQEPLFATKAMIEFYLMTFEKLKVLNLNCFNEFNQELMEIVKEKHPNIQRLFYGANVFKSCALISENRTFRIHPRKKRCESLSNQVLMRAIDVLPQLENIWISELDRQRQDIIYRLRHMKKLRHIAFGKYPHRDGELTISQDYQGMSLKAWQQLSSLKNIFSVAFIKISLSSQMLQKLFINNRGTLRTIYFYDCEHVTDSLFKTIKAHNHCVREVFMYRCGEVSFKGENIWELSNLETLVLKECNNINGVIAETHVKRLINLTHLNLNGSAWVDDNFMVGASNLRNLNFLHIGHTNISSHSSEPVQQMKKLKALAIGCTRINACTTQEIGLAVPGIKKLSLFGLSGSAVVIGRGIMTKVKLSRMGEVLPELNYLDIGGCNRAQDDMFEKYPKLQHVNLWMTPRVSERKKQELRFIGINIIEDV